MSKVSNVHSKMNLQVLLCKSTLIKSILLFPFIFFPSSTVGFTQTASTQAYLQGNQVMVSYSAEGRVITERYEDLYGNYVDLYYVSAKMSGNGSGTSPSNAMAIDDVMAHVNSGDILVLLDNNGVINVSSTLSLKDDMKVYSFNKTSSDLQIELGLDATLTLSNISGFGAAKIKGENSSADVIELADNSIIQNIIISGGKNGVVGNNINSVSLLDTTVSQTGKNGVDLSNLTGTASISNLTIDKVGKNGFSFIGSTGLLNFTDISIIGAGDTAVMLKDSSCPNNFTVRKIKHSGTGPVMDMEGLSTGGVEIVNSPSGAGISAKAGAGMILKDLACNVTFKLPVELTDTINGVSISNSHNPTANGSVIFNSIKIENTSETSIALDTRNINVYFIGGSVIQNINNAAIVSVASGDTGIIEFDGISINAKKGSGLNFSGANGIYNFQGGMSLSDTSKGIEISGGSQGIFTFENYSIFNTSGAAVFLSGNAPGAKVKFVNGTITQSNNASTISVTNNDKSNLTFSVAANITATSGKGLVFEAANGKYNFSGTASTPIKLTGTTNGVAISGNSTGTFAFANANVSGTKDSAVSIDNGSSTAKVAFIGGSISQGNGKILSLGDGDKTNLSFSGTNIDTTQGKGLLFNGVEGNYTFNENGVAKTKIDLGTTGSIVVSNLATGLLTFNNVDITGSSIADTTALLKLSGNTNTAKNPIIFNNGSITQSGAGGTINVSNKDAGNLTLAGTKISASQGRGITFQNISGNYAFDNVLIDMNNKVGGIYIDNSSATFDFVSTTIKNTLGYAMAVSGVLISSSIYINGSSFGETSEGSVLNFYSHDKSSINISGATISADNKDAVYLSNANGTYSFSDTTITAKGSANGVNLNESNANIKFLKSNVLENSTSGSLVYVSSNDNSHLSFDDSTVPVSSISSSHGKGIYLSSAGGIYDFSGADVSLSGTEYGVTVNNNSTGTVKFGKINISDTKNSNVVLDNHNKQPTVSFGKGSISQSGNVTLLNIAQNDKSSLSFTNTTLSVNNDTGLLFDGARGKYTFRDAVIDINNSDASLTIKDVVEGSFSFQGTAITGKSSAALVSLSHNSAPVIFKGASFSQKGVGDTMHVAPLDTTKLSIHGLTTITGSGGKGVVLDSVEGTYDFSDSDINMSGVTSGIDISNTSKGKFIFDGTNIMGNYSIAPLALSNSPMSVNFKSGSITQSGSGKILSLRKGDVSKLTFSGTAIKATAGEGLIFDGVDGSYTFNENAGAGAGAKTKIDLGTTGSIVVSNLATGLLTFNNVDITGSSIADTTALLKLSGNTNTAKNPTIFNNGSITQSGVGEIIKVSNGDAGYLSFTGATQITAGMGSGLVFDSTAGTYGFSGTAISMNAPNSTVNISNTSKGSLSFNNTTITGSNGATNMSISGNSIPITFSGGSLSNNSGAAPIVSVSNKDASILSFTGTSITATSGKGLVFEAANGKYNFSGTASTPIKLTGTTNGVAISGNSTGTFAFANANVSGTKDSAVSIDNGSSTAKVAFIGGSISQGNGKILSLGDGDKTNLSFSDTDIDITQGDGLVFNHANGTYTFSAVGITPIKIKGTTNGINISGGSSGIFAFTNADISGTTSSAVSINNPGTPNQFATVTFTGGTIRQDKGDLLSFAWPDTTNLTFNGTDILLNTGPGLVFSDAKGTYNFIGTQNTPIILNGTKNGVKIVGGIFQGVGWSNGIFNFKNIHIYESTAESVYVNFTNSNLPQPVITFSDSIIHGDGSAKGQNTAMPLVYVGTQDNSNLTFQKSTINGVDRKAVAMGGLLGLGNHAFNNSTIIGLASADSSYCEDGQLLDIDAFTYYPNNNYALVFDNSTIIFNDQSTHGCNKSIARFTGNSNSNNPIANNLKANNSNIDFKGKESNRIGFLFDNCYFQAFDFGSATKMSGKNFGIKIEDEQSCTINFSKVESVGDQKKVSVIGNSPSGSCNGQAWTAGGNNCPTN